jgi:hypothetical protein
MDMPDEMNVPCPWAILPLLVQAINAPKPPMSPLEEQITTK